MLMELEVVHAPSEILPSPQPLSHYVAQSVEDYFSQLGNAKPSGLYKRVLEEIEVPLLQKVMKHARGNQCKASTWLEISRGTLRKKLKQYGLE